MLTLFYSPHMTSVDNEAKRASGHADVPLSAAGRQEAGEIGTYYKDYTLDAVFCSDLQRATVTAQIAFAERGVPIIPDARLRECDYGDLTQYPVEQIDKEFPRRITEPFPHGQSVLMVAQGIGTFLQDILQEYDGKTVVVIGHRATKYGIHYWFSDTSLADVVNAPWEWLEIPIWRYEFDAHKFEQRFRASRSN